MTHENQADPTTGYSARSAAGNSERIDTVVIGGGQAGLATGYHLKQQGVPYVILEANPRIGDAWRNRWDSLRLFTPARYSGLPGLPFPGRPSYCPTKDETADYLEAYASHFELPVRSGVKVDSLTRAGDLFKVASGDDKWLADNVIVATGPYQRPRIPPFASELDDGIVQLHSKQYRNPSQLQEGPALVVGAGNSGAEISIEVAGHHQTWLSGPDTGQEPVRAGESLASRLVTPIMWFAATRVLTVNTPMGRKVRDHFLDPPRGIPLGRVRREDFIDAGIERVPRVAGVRDGFPLLEDGGVLEVSNVVWCTGYVLAFDWIDVSLPTHNGVPIHDRGVVESCPGLYFIGLLFLFSLSSALVGGVGRDAEYIVNHIIQSREAPLNDDSAQPPHERRVRAPSSAPG